MSRVAGMITCRAGAATPAPRTSTIGGALGAPCVRRVPGTEPRSEEYDFSTGFGGGGAAGAEPDGLIRLRLVALG
jgi:hypothetical protein